MTEPKKYRSILDAGGGRHILRIAAASQQYKPRSFYVARYYLPGGALLFTVRGATVHQAERYARQQIKLHNAATDTPTIEINHSPAALWHEAEEDHAETMATLEAAAREIESLQIELGEARAILAYIDRIADLADAAQKLQGMKFTEAIRQQMIEEAEQAREEIER